ncbi:reticulon B9 [Olea europaea subsp. europaea]|uniref:Reticulon-like protein n=1 Tax=Olea europaea subsp. europaea TaxID=158383 RepID=A0A8S0PZE3_OLEEU|nr:reticulon B9 [Olea europaea subsp. europaea]
MESHSWQNLASGKWSATGAGYFPGIRRVNELLKIRVLHVFAKARPLFLYFGAAHGGGGGCGGDGAGTWAQLQWVASHGGACYLSFIPKKQHKCSTDNQADSDDQIVYTRRWFGHEKPLHAILGEGTLADIVSWRNKNLSASILIGFTVIWFLFEVVEYNFVTFFCHVSIVVMLVVFAWSTGAGLAHRNPPDLRALTIPESTFRWLLTKIHRFLVKFYDVSSGKDLKTFFLAIAFLWVLSGIGNYFSSFNLLYTGFLCLATIPALYERYQDEVDYLASKGNRDMKKLYKKFDIEVLNKIPRGPVKEKKRL